MARAFLVVVIAITTSVCAVAQLVPVPNVDPFTGSFSAGVPILTIPGPHGSGFTLQLSYSSDVTAEEEASYVGYGWTLNMPSIMRSKVGFPDDVRRGHITNKQKNPFTSQSLTLQGNMELVSLDFGEETPAGSTAGTGASPPVGDVPPTTPTPSLPTTPVPGSSPTTPDKGKGPGASLNAGLSVVVTCSDVTGFDAFATLGASQGVGYSWFGAGMGLNSKGGASFGLGFTSPRIHGNIYSFNPSAGEGLPPFGLHHSNGKVVMGALTARAAGPGGYEGGVQYSTTIVDPVTTQEQVYAGYLYTPEAAAGDNKNVTLDYMTERDRPIATDKAAPLPMPIPAPDKFMVSAPEISGTFRLHHSMPLRLRPPEMKSVMNYTFVSGKVIAPPLGIGAGLSIPFTVPREMISGNLENDDYLMSNKTHASVDMKLFPGYHLIEEWQKIGPLQPPVFRYEGDMADVVRYTHSNEHIPDWAMSSQGGVDLSLYFPVNQLGIIRTNRSITWKTSEEKAFRDPNPLITGEGRDAGLDFGNGTISEFSITSENGYEYDFSVPIWTYDEKSVSLTTDGLGLEIEKKRLFYNDGAEINEDNVKKGGSSYMHDWYASSWLVRSITTPTFVDMDNNGPDEGDKGGWTLFTYTPQTNLRMRAPHNGFMVDRLDVDNPNDDVLSYASGRELMRYPKEIRTATHVAEFIMNDEAGEPERKDAYEAWGSRGKCQASPSAHSGNNKQPYLVMIKLYAIVGGVKGPLLQTVHFQYDYSLMEGNPSSAAGAGKLTLRRVWTENRDVREAHINPLTFYYEYPTHTPGTPVPERDYINAGVLSTRYPAAFPIQSYSNSVENPDYDAEEIDAWGYRQGVQPRTTVSTPVNDETMRYGPLQSWQDPYEDPAAWRLKSMKLPTGGSIVVEYEARTYSYVQDKRAMVMGTAVDVLDSKTYTIDLESVGAPSGITYTQTLEYEDMIKKHFINSGQPVYYDVGFRTDPCDDEGDNIIHAKGYTKILACTTNSGSPRYIQLELEGPPMTLTGSMSWNDMRSIGKHYPLSSAVGEYRAVDEGRCYCDGDASIDEMLGLMPLALTNLVSSSISFAIDDKITLDESMCLFRLPVFDEKTGGGVRVKRLLTISPDETNEEGDVACIGVEYDYTEVGENGKKTSSGVAINEPWMMRTENPLVGIDTASWSRAGLSVVDGGDLVQYEGPVGMSLMPGASVGYRKVTMRGLNKATNAIPTQVHTFLTARDIIPLTFSSGDLHRERYDISESSYLMMSSSSIDLVLAQSFKLEYRMYHGLPASVETFTPSSSENSATLISSTKYEYVGPNEDVLVFDTLDRALRYKRLGDYEDLVFDGRRIEERMSKTDIDFTIDILPFPTWPGLGLVFNNVNHRVATYVTNKIIHRQPLLARVITYEKGAIDTAETFAYDISTGFPAITRGSDIYHGSNSTKSVPTGDHQGTIHTVTMPAHRQYIRLSHKSLGNRYRFKDDEPVPGFGLATVTPHASLAWFDVELPGGSTNVPDPDGRREYIRTFFNAGDIISYHLETETERTDPEYYTVYYASEISKGVRVVIRPLSGTTPTLTGGEPVFTLVESGKVNQLTSESGKLTLYGVNDSEIRLQAHTLRWLNILAEDFSVGARREFVYQPYKSFDPLYTYSAFQWANGANVYKPSTGDIAVTDPCNSSISNLANVALINYYYETGYGPYYYPYYVGMFARDVLSCGCGTAWPNCSPVSFGYGLAGTDTLLQKWDKWDRWMRFQVTDNGNLVAASYKAPRNHCPAGLTFYDGNFSCVKSLLVPTTTTETCSTRTTPTVKLLSMSATKYELRYIGDYGEINEPTVQFEWITPYVYDGSSGSIGSFARTGAFPTSGSTPEMMDDWESYWLPSPHPTNVTRTGWRRTAYIRLRTDDGIPIEIIDADLDTSCVYLGSDGFTPLAIFENQQYGEAIADNMEECVSCDGTPHTGRKSRRLYGASGPTLVHTSSSPASPDRSPHPDQMVRVQCWIRPFDSLSTDPVIGNINISGHYLTADDHVATVHAWQLYDFAMSYGDIDGDLVITAEPDVDFLVDDVTVGAIYGGKTLFVSDEEYRPTATLGTSHLPIINKYDTKGQLSKVMVTSSSGYLRETYLDGHLPEWGRPADMLAGGGEFDALIAAPSILQEKVDEMWKGKLNKPDALQKMSAKGKLLDAKVNLDGIEVDSPVVPSRKEDQK